MGFQSSGVGNAQYTTSSRSDNTVHGADIRAASAEVNPTPRYMQSQDAMYRHARLARAKMHIESGSEEDEAIRLAMKAYPAYNFYDQAMLKAGLESASGGVAQQPYSNRLAVADSRRIAPPKAKKGGSVKANDGGLTPNQRGLVGTGAGAGAGALMAGPAGALVGGGVGYLAGKYGQSPAANDKSIINVPRDEYNDLMGLPPAQAGAGRGETPYVTMPRSQYEQFKRMRENSARVVAPKPAGAPYKKGGRAIPAQAKPPVKRPMATLPMPPAQRKGAAASMIPANNLAVATSRRHRPPAGMMAKKGGTVKAPFGGLLDRFRSAGNLPAPISIQSSGFRPADSLSAPVSGSVLGQPSANLTPTGAARFSEYPSLMSAQPQLAGAAGSLQGISAMGGAPSSVSTMPGVNADGSIIPTGTPRSQIPRTAGGTGAEPISGSVIGQPSANLTPTDAARFSEYPSLVSAQPQLPPPYLAGDTTTKKSVNPLDNTDMTPISRRGGRVRKAAGGGKIRAAGGGKPKAQVRTTTTGQDMNWPSGTWDPKATVRSIGDSISDAAKWYWDQVKNAGGGVADAAQGEDPRRIATTMRGE